MCISPKKFIAAAVIEQNGKILIAQRAKEDAFFGLWEFPGGKVEAGETLQECLKRELREELDINAEIGEYLCTSSFYLMDSTTLRFAHHERVSYEMHVFMVRSFQGEIKLNEHSACAWVTPEELSNYTYPDPDLPIVELLQKA
jgi:mutator protein MutT